MKSRNCPRPQPHIASVPIFGKMGSSRPATTPAATRRQQLLILLIGLLVVLSPHCVGAKLFKRRDKNAPAQTIESTPESSDDDAPPAAADEETAVATETAAEQVCDEMLARSLVKANDDKAIAIAERDEALTKVSAGEDKVAQLEQVSIFFGTQYVPFLLLLALHPNSHVYSICTFAPASIGTASQGRRGSCLHRSCQEGCRVRGRWHCRRPKGGCHLHSEDSRRCRCQNRGR